MFPVFGDADLHIFEGLVYSEVDNVHAIFLVKDTDIHSHPLTFLLGQGHFERLLTGWLGETKINKSMYNKWYIYLIK